MKEIERKFLLPPCRISKFLHKCDIEYRALLIEQFYLLSDESRAERYRKMGKRYFHTVKEGRGLVKEEHETSIDKDLYILKKREYNARPLKKIRYIFRADKKEFVIDSFKKELKGLNVLEIEFESEEEARAFELPPFLAKIVLAEVTDDPDFTNARLYEKRKIPTIEKDLHILLQEIIEKDDFLKASIQVDLFAYESAAHSIKAVIYSLVHSIFANKSAIERGDEDPERLHQLRVAIRKIRTLFSKFDLFFEENWHKSHSQALAQWMKKSNPIRDVDVYLLKIDHYKSLIKPKHKEGLEHLRRYLQEKKESMLQLLQEILNDEQFRATLVELYCFCKKDDLHGLSAEASGPIIVPVKKILKKSYKDIIIKGKRLDLKSSDKKYHNLRIEVKKLRYSMEFFSSIFEQKSYKKILKSLKDLQQILGDHQDLVVQISYIEELKNLKDLQDMTTIKALEALQKSLKAEEKKKRSEFKGAFKKLAKRKKPFRKMICRF